MHWIAPSEKDDATDTLEKRLVDAAVQFRANSGLKSQEYSAPVSGLTFLHFAEVRFVSNHRRAAAGQSAWGNRPKDYSGGQTRELSIHGVETTDETGRPCRLNLAVHGLDGDIRHGEQVINYYD